MCDVVTAMLLDRLEQKVAAERQVAAAFIAAGAKGVEMPTSEQARADFAAALLAEPEVIDREREELLTALGVR